MYYFYVLQNVDNPSDIYTGYTADLKRRLNDHNQGRQQATRGRQWELIYYEAYKAKRVAQKREQTIKRNGRMRTFLMDRILSQSD